MPTIPRVRMIAGPNGSGKSTIRGILPETIQGIYINPDEIEKRLKEKGALNLRRYNIESDQEEIDKFLRNSFFVKNQQIPSKKDIVHVDQSIVNLINTQLNPYIASVLSDFIRHKLLEKGVSFTFETVMSSKDKIDFLRKSQAKGYRVYLYYIATDDPEINKSRVRNRVILGGHTVPDEKITPRYYRSLELLVDAIRTTNRAYIFDNSTDGKDKTWLAEITNGKKIEIKSNLVPNWFQKFILEKIDTKKS